MNKAYEICFRALAGMVFAGDNGQRELSFESQGEDSKHPFDTRIVIVNRALLNPDGSGPVRYLDVGSGWQATALLLALILATPVSWRRRGWAVFLGLLCIHFLILLSLSFIIWNESMEISLVTLSPFWKQISNGFRDVLVSQFTVAIPVLVWVLVTFRREDMIRILGRRGEGASDSSSAKSHTAGT
ncbi:MAG: hypothetical protein WCD79_11950 [Chthoniobacteraceae bacterium]